MSLKPTAAKKIRSKKVGFNGESGYKPSTEARRYVYKVLITTLQEDLWRCAGYLTSGLASVSDRRLAVRAARRILKELIDKSTGHDRI